MLLIAVVKPLTNVLDLLLREHNAAVGLDNGEAIRSACARGRVDMLRMLEEGGGDLGAQDGEPMLTAAEHGQREVIDYLLESEVYAGADMEGALKEALLQAGLNGHEEVVETMLQNRTQPDAEDGFEIIKACRSKKTKMMKMLLDSGCPVSDHILRLSRSEDNPELR
jgi:ankyrin repeat protein